MKIESMTNDQNRQVEENNTRMAGSVKREIRKRKYREEQEALSDSLRDKMIQTLLGIPEFCQTAANYLFTSPTIDNLSFNERRNITIHFEKGEYSYWVSTEHDIFTRSRYPLRILTIRRTKGVLNGIAPTQEQFGKRAIRYEKDGGVPEEEIICQIAVGEPIAPLNADCLAYAHIFITTYSVKYYEDGYCRLTEGEKSVRFNLTQNPEETNNTIDQIIAELNSK